VSITGVTPAAIERQSYHGMSAPGASLTIQFGGDLSALNGRRVHLFVEVPDPLFETTIPSWSVDEANERLQISLQGTIGIAAGTYTGTLQLRFCLDAECSEQLGNSPYPVPYSIAVLPGPELSPPAVHIEVPFGTVPAVQPVALRLATGTTRWDMFAWEPPTYGAFSAAVVADDPPRIDITPQLMAPGTYSAEYLIDHWISNPAVLPKAFKMQRRLAVTYTVTENPALPVAMDRPEATYRLVRDDPSQRHTQLRIVPQSSGGSLTLDGVRYSSAPAAAAGHANVHAWLYGDRTFLGSYFVIPCGMNPLAVSCLPPGTYTGSIAYRHTSAGGDVSIVEHRVQMDIEP
jgi:hypothetical protein